MHFGAGGAFDLGLLRWIDQHRVAPLTWFTRALMTFGTSMTVIVSCIVIGAILVVVFRAWRSGLAVGIAVFVAGDTCFVLKHWIGRVRPPHNLALVQLDGYAMPSSHAALTASVAVVLLFTVPWKSVRQRRAAAVVLTSIVVLIGLAMIYLGAHWATDVLVGWPIGIIVGAAVGAPLRFGAKQASATPAPPVRAR